MQDLIQRYGPPRAAEGAGGGDATGGDANAGAADKGAADKGAADRGAADNTLGGADAVKPPAAELYKPEGVPEHLFGATNNETIDKMFGAYKGARDELAKGKPAVPAAKDYQWNWSEAVKGQGGIASDDAAIGAFAEIAHEHGYTQQQIDAIPKFFDKLIEKGVIEKPFDSAQLLTDLAPAGYRGTPEEVQARGSQRLAAAEAWIGQLPASAGFDDAMRQEMRLLTTSAAGVKVIETFMKSGMNPSASAGGNGSQQGAVTKGDLDRRVADPRNDAYGQKYEPDFAAETRRMFKQLYPD